MSSTAKPQKDRQHASSPRLVPRPTAASTARAARNACNRNLMPSMRHSPTRPSSTPVNSKERQMPRLSQRIDSKTDIVKERCHTPRITQKTDSRTDTKTRNHLPISPLHNDAKSDIKINRCLDIQPKIDQVGHIEPPEPELMNITVVVTEMDVIESREEDHDGVPVRDICDADIFEIKQDSEEMVEKQEICECEPQPEPQAIEEMPSPRLTPSSRPTTPQSIPSRPQTPRTNVSSRPQTPRGASRPVTPVLPPKAPTSPLLPLKAPTSPLLPLKAPTSPLLPLKAPTSPLLPLKAPTSPLLPLKAPTSPVLPPRAPTTPVSRPATPQRVPPERPTTPKSQIPQIPQSPRPKPCPPSPQSYAEDDIKAVFMVKQKQFNKLKKELDLKQQATLEVFESLRALRERMCREGVAGGGEGVLQELVVFNVADWTATDLAQLCKDAAASSLDTAVDLLNTALPIDECALSELDARVTSVPTRFADLCLQAFTARQELIDWVKELIENNALREGSGECLERIARYNAQGLELCEALRELKSRADDAVDTVTQLSRRACAERGALIAVGESLVREIARLRQDIELRIATITEMHEMRLEAESAKALEEARRELEEERLSRAAGKDKLSSAESQLRQARNRIAKMDRQLREAEASITNLTATVKSLEDQSRQKEVQLEARARKLKESLKTGEVATGYLAQQRDSLQAEVAELKNHIANLTAQHKLAIQELSSQLKDSKAELEEQRKATQAEIELKISAETALAESTSLIQDMKAKIQEMENNKPNPDLPTEREMDLWAELQATKETLRSTEDEVTACRREKVRFLETLTKIAESENKVGMQQKLAGELLSKEEIMGKMQTQIRELTKNIKLNEQKVVQYEQYVHELQAHNRTVANCLDAPDGISYQDLQQEIMNLKMKLLESVHRNEELSELLVQKEQHIVQQDKTSRAQARVIKVREELINMLKNKETEQSRVLTVLQQDLEHRMKIVDEVNKQIAAKADEIQELFGTLENKQQQIHRLEKIVVALEEQQRRAQAQRIRHEEKIAALEHELAAGGARRERKFLFF